MDSNLIIAIAVIIVLAITFMISFVLYHKAPPPEGCEDIKISMENCKNCSNKECSKHPENEDIKTKDNDIEELKHQLEKMKNSVDEEKKEEDK